MYSKEATKRFLAKRVARPASAGVIVENDEGKALVLKAHYKPYWSFPGGWIEHGQTPRMAALRELEEETSLVLDEDDVSFTLTVARHSDIMQTYQFIFKANEPVDVNAEITLQANEIAEYAFVSKQQVNDEPLVYGGAVQAWAAGDEAGYYEQEM